MVCLVYQGLQGQRGPQVKEETQEVWDQWVLSVDQD